MGPLQVSQEISIGAVAGMSRLRLPARADVDLPVELQDWSTFGLISLGVQFLGAD